MVKLLFPKNMITTIEKLNGNDVNNTNSESVNEGKFPRATLSCHPNSHPFVNRTLILDKPVKIGRSVGHNNKSSPNNAIFDCKVLSRFHAVILYDDGKFYLKDTKSSNGTFVNNERLSKSGEESAPKEIFSGDVIQFGVEVTENTRNLTHGCVIGTLALYHTDGEEAIPSVLHTFGERGGNKVTLEDLYHLNQYVQESLSREQMLETKLSALKTLLNTLRESTEVSWKALISNTSLLSRVELLEVQLKCYSKKFADDQLREELRLLQEDKNTYEGVVKDYFQKISDEKLEAMQKCQDLNRALANLKTEFASTRSFLGDCQNELRELALKNTVQEKTIEDLGLRLTSKEEEHNEKLQKLMNEISSLNDQIKLHKKTEQLHRETIRELETHGDYAQKQVIWYQNKVEELQKYHNDILCKLVNPAIIKDKINDVDLLKSWIAIYEEALKNSIDNASTVRSNTEKLRGEKVMKEISSRMLEEELNKCGAELRTYREQLNAEMKAAELPLDIMDELPERMEKKIFLVDHDIKLSEGHYEQIEKMVAVAMDNLAKCRVALAIEEEQLEVCEKQIANFKLAIRTLCECAESVSYAQEAEKMCVEDVSSLKRQLSDAHDAECERRNATAQLATHFGEFMATVDRQLTALETAIGDEFERGNIADELKALKGESTGLVGAVDELQATLTQLQLLPESTLEQPASMQIDETDWSATDSMIVLREKLSYLSSEKCRLERSLNTLQLQYTCVTSYPYCVDMRFLLPAIVCFCLYSVGIVFSYIFHM